MSELLKGDEFGSKIYERFPRIYKEVDPDTNYSLKRYIQSANAGGFEPLIDEINGIVDLVDNQKIPTKYLEYMFRSLGIEIFNGLPEKFLRNLVPVINDLYSRKGNVSVMEYLADVISGVSVEVDTSRCNHKYRYILGIKLNMDTSVVDYFPDIDHLNRISSEFLPFFCSSNLLFTYSFSDEQRLIFKKEPRLDYITHKITESEKIGIHEELIDSITLNSVKDQGFISFPLGHIENTCCLNSNRCCLNSDFILNTCTGYDIITIAGEQKIRELY